MAKYDHGGGCACGLQAVCDCQPGHMKAVVSQKNMDIEYWKNEVRKLNKRIEELENRAAYGNYDPSR